MDFSEQPRRLQEGESEAITIAFADTDADLYGIARIGRAMTATGELISGLGLLFAGDQPRAVRAETAEPTEDSGSWGGAWAAGVETEVIEPLKEWSVLFASEDGRHGFDLQLSATTAAGGLDGHTKVARTGGMEGYEQLVQVTGTVTVDGSDRELSGLGQRGHSWGAPDWTSLDSARTIGVWLPDGNGMAITSVRPSKARSHADELTHALLFGLSDQPVQPDEIRISTTYDTGGRQQNAGIEYRIGPDDHGRRLSGEVACGTTLDLGTLDLHCAFFTWLADDGTRGVGRYDVLAVKAAP